jgi:D-alanine transaminase
MSRTVFLNGQYMPEEDAKVSIFDRGFLMGDGVYEVVSVLDGKLLEFDGHIARLERSLNELEMDKPKDFDNLLEIHRELVRRNNVQSGGVYLQITRGAADRDFVYPADAEPTLVLFTQERRLIDTPASKTGIKVIFAEDLRWHRRDIKTVQLLYPSMCKMMAKAAGKHDAWLVEDGKITEGSSNNAYIVKDGQIITRELSNDILHGITRNSVLRLAKEAQLQVVERSFTEEEARNADEAFITSATTFVQPVVEIDNARIGDGTPGPVAKRLLEIYIEESRKTGI